MPKLRDPKTGRFLPNSGDFESHKRAMFKYIHSEKGIATRKAYLKRIDYNRKYFKEYYQKNKIKEMEYRKNNNLWKQVNEKKRLRVSSLANFIVCPHRAKLELYGEKTGNRPTHAMKQGTQLHRIYSIPIKSFDRRVLRYEINKNGRIQSRKIGEYILRGIPDDYLFNLNEETQEKTVSLVEVKTTSKPRLYSWEEDRAILQLRLYIFIMEPIFKKLGYEIDETHYLEVYHQEPYELIKRVEVTKHEDMEKYIKHVIEVFQGLAPMRYPDKWVCQSCPWNIKKRCKKWCDTYGH